MHWLRWTCALVALIWASAAQATTHQELQLAVTASGICVGGSLPNAGCTADPCPGSGTCNFNSTSYGSSGAAVNPFEARAQVQMPSTQTLSNMMVYCGIAPGGGGVYTFRFRKNGANGNQTCTVSGSAQTCQDTNPAHADTYVGGTDFIDVSLAASGNPTTTTSICHATFTVVDSGAATSPIVLGSELLATPVSGDFCGTSIGGGKCLETSAAGGQFVAPRASTITAMTVTFDDVVSGTPSLQETYTFLNAVAGTDFSALTCTVTLGSRTCTVTGLSVSISAGLRLAARVNATSFVSRARHIVFDVGGTGGSWFLSKSLIVSSPTFAEKWASFPTSAFALYAAPSAATVKNLWVTSSVMGSTDVVGVFRTGASNPISDTALTKTLPAGTGLAVTDAVNTVGIAAGSLNQFGINAGSSSGVIAFSAEIVDAAPPTATPTITTTPLPTNTFTNTPLATNTFTSTPTVTATPTSTATYTAMPTIAVVWKQALGTDEAYCISFKRLGHYLYCGTAQYPAKLIRIDTNNPALRYTLPFPADGFHGKLMQLAYVTGQNKFYGLFVSGATPAITIAQIDPGQLGTGDATGPMTYIDWEQDLMEDAGTLEPSLATDQTHIFVLTSTSPDSHIVRYRLSDQQKIVAILTHHSGGETINYDATSGKIYAGGQGSVAFNFAPWVAVGDPTAMTFTVVNFAPGLINPQPVDDSGALSPYAYFGTDTQGGGAVASVVRSMLSSPSAQNVIQFTNPQYDTCYSVEVLNSFVWALMEDSLNHSVPGFSPPFFNRGVLGKIDPNTFTPQWYQFTDPEATNSATLPNELQADDANYGYVSFWQLYGTPSPAIIEKIVLPGFPTGTPTSSTTPSGTFTSTPTITRTPTITPSITPGGATLTPTPSFSPTQTPTNTPTQTPTNTSLGITACCQCPGACSQGGVCPNNCNAVLNASCSSVPFGSACNTNTPTPTVGTFTPTPVLTRTPTPIANTSCCQCGLIGPFCQQGGSCPNDPNFTCVVHPNSMCGPSGSCIDFTPTPTPGAQGCTDSSQCPAGDACVPASSLPTPTP